MTELPQQPLPSRLLFIRGIRGQQGRGIHWHHLACKQRTSLPYWMNSWHGGEIPQYGGSQRPEPSSCARGGADWTHPRSPDQYLQKGEKVRQLMADVWRLVDHEATQPAGPLHLVMTQHSGSPQLAAVPPAGSPQLATAPAAISSCQRKKQRNIVVPVAAAPPDLVPPEFCSVRAAQAPSSKRAALPKCQAPVPGRATLPTPGPAVVVPPEPDPGNVSGRSQCPGCSLLASSCPSCSLLASSCPAVPCSSPAIPSAPASSPGVLTAPVLQSPGSPPAVSSVPAGYR
nr:proline-rich protein 36-like [Paramormyrops kingsleyae]